MFEKESEQLETANLICQQAQQVFKNILNDIHWHMKELSSAKTNHFTGIISSLLRLAFTVLDYVLKSVSSLENLFKFFYAAIASMHTGNAIGHIAGFFWTRNEIQELEKHQDILNTSEIKIKQLFDDINHGLKMLQKNKSVLVSCR
jgi:hypothetical protein